MPDTGQPNRPADPVGTATAVGRFLSERPVASSAGQTDRPTKTDRPVDPLVAAAIVGRFTPDRPTQLPRRKKRRRRQQARAPPSDNDDDHDLDCYSIAEFCRRHGISESFFFKLQARGEAPDTIAVGSRRLITREAARQWRERHMHNS